VVGWHPPYDGIGEGAPALRRVSGWRRRPRVRPGAGFRGDVGREGGGEWVVGWHPPYDVIGEGAPALSRGLGVVAEAPGRARGGVSW
jgi:hypothetical protein